MNVGPPKVAVTVALSPALVPRLPAGADTTVGRSVLTLLSELGVPGQPVVEIVEGDGHRAVAVSVEGTIVRYPPAVLRRAWVAVAPRDLAPLPITAPGGDDGAFPDGWLPALAELDRPDLPEILERFLACLVREVALERPTCLLTPAAVATHPILSTVGSALLELGNSLREVVPAAEAAFGPSGPSPSGASAVEALHRRLAPRRVAICATPEYLAGLLHRRRVSAAIPVFDQSVIAMWDESFGWAQAALLEVIPWLPELVWSPSPDVPPGMVAIEVDGRTLPPITGLQPGQLLVDGSPHRVALTGLDGELSLNPMLGTVATVVSGTTGDEFVDQGLSFWTPLGLVSLLLYTDLHRRMPNLLGADEMEHLLGALAITDPVLVDEALERWSVARLTALLRALANEGAPIADLRSVLEHLVGCEDLSDGCWLGDGGADQLLPQARAGMARVIAYRASGTFGAIAGIRLSEEIAGRVEDCALDGTGLESLQAAVLDDVWGQIGRARLPKMTLALLADDHLRPAISELIAAELPDVPVLGVSEVGPELPFYDVGTEEGLMATRVQATQELVERLLSDIVEVYAEDDAGNLMFQYESTEVFVDVEPWRDMFTLVHIRSNTNRDVPPSPELFQWLATEGGDFVFGHLSALEEEGAVSIWFRHTLLGNWLDADEFIQAVVLVANVADELDDEIKQRFGGVRAVETDAVEAVEAAEAPAEGSSAPAGV